MPSPLLGPAAYQPLADALATGLPGPGHDARVADVTVTGDAAAFADHLVAQAAGIDLLVPHSNAGRFAPAVAERVGATVVYVDATLPGPEPGLAARLAEKVADDGLLLPWTEWWPREELEEVVPAEWFAVLEQTQPRLPPSFLLDEPPTPLGWQSHRSGYLALGEGYAEQLAWARGLGWAVAQLEGEHLHHLVDPAAVAEAVLHLAAEVAPT